MDILFADNKLEDSFLNQMLQVIPRSLQSEKEYHDIIETSVPTRLYLTK